MKNLIKILCLLQILFVGCRDESKIQDLERQESSMRNSIVTMLDQVPSNEFVFKMKDTIINLPNESNLFLGKNSFLAQDSNLYNGDVTLKYSFSKDSSEIFAQQFKENSFDVQSLMGIIKINALNENGEPLIINPDYAPKLFFHPKLNLNTCTYYKMDSLTNQYSTPLYFFKKFKDVPISNIEWDGYIGGNAIFSDSSSEDDEKTENYRGTKVSKKELIGYEMTLKDFGTYYISRDDNTKNLQTTSISIDLISSDITSMDWGKVSLFLVTNQTDYNYFLKAQNTGDGSFKFIKSVGVLDLKLPLDNNYKLLAYGIDGDKCYLFRKNGVKLKSSNSLSYQLKQVSFEKLKTEIKKF